MTTLLWLNTSKYWTSNKHSDWLNYVIGPQSCQNKMIKYINDARCSELFLLHVTGKSF